VPLSEHEQRLLEQMERALYAEDPKFASALQGADLRAHFRRRVYFAVTGFAVGVGLLMTGVVTMVIPVSIGGFLVMLACAFLAISSWRRMPAPGEITPVHRRTARQPRRRARFMEWIEERWRRRRDEQGH
jgi:Protein of unknown function (DUF3040)